MNKVISVIIIGILLIASFFIGYSIKETGSTPSEIQNLHQQITNLQNQNSQLQQQIYELQKNSEDEKTPTQNIPSSVLAKYEELELLYKKSLGASINYCSKNTEKIYTVSGSGGFTGVTFYYTEDGREIGQSSWTDEMDINNPLLEPPVNIQEYQCNVIKESEQFVN